MGLTTSIKEESKPVFEKTIVIVSGFFDPVGIQHITLFKEASKIGNYLIAGLNSDECGMKKKGQKCFMPFKDRKVICENLFMIDEVVAFEDDDMGTACLLIRDIYNRYKHEIDDGTTRLVFANGGDANGSDRVHGQDICPEQKYVDENFKGKVELVYGVGGYDKSASSSQYLREWVNKTMIRYNIDFELNGKY